MQLYHVKRQAKASGKQATSGSGGSGRANRTSAIKAFSKVNYVLPLKILDGHFGAKAVNIYAWKAFNLTWERYIETIVLPLCNKTDIERFHIIKTCEPPATVGRVRSIAGNNHKTALRLWYMMYNVVDNSIRLDLDLPESLYPLEVGSSKYVMRPETKLKRIRKANAKITPLKRQRDADLEERAEMRDAAVQRQRITAFTINEKRSIDFDYARLKKQEYENFASKKAWVSAKAKHFNKCHERLNAVGGGTPGTIQIFGSFTLSWYIQELLVGNDII
jgi:hypothetical protein